MVEGGDGDRNQLMSLDVTPRLSRAVTPGRALSILKALPGKKTGFGFNFGLETSLTTPKHGATSGVHHHGGDAWFSGKDSYFFLGSTDPASFGPKQQKHFLGLA